MKLALLGSPVLHSLSPAMHRAAFADAGLEGDYVARDVDSAAFSECVEEIRSGVLHGANVTMPHKFAAYAASDETSDRTVRVGAVNTLSFRNGLIVGDNSDIEGVRYAWRAAGLPPHDPVVILGAGGAAAAALVATEDRRHYIVARRPGTAGGLVARTGVDAEVVAWGDPMPRGVYVNATSLGMHGESLPEDVVDAAIGLLDMAYGNVPTLAVRLARDRGIPTADGLDMLVGQAAASFRIWTGMSVAASVFRIAAEEELLKRAGWGTRVEE